eukprot:5179345-Amphidinium_carterae.1
MPLPQLWAMPLAPLWGKLLRPLALRQLLPWLPARLPLRPCADGTAVAQAIVVRYPIIVVQHRLVLDQ